MGRGSVLDTVPPSTVPAAPPRLARRALWPHAAGLLVVLLAGLAWVGEGAFSADEGAAIVQAQHLADGDGWIVDHPFPEADPDGAAYPWELGLIGRDSIAPFGKHPFYASLLTIGHRVGGWSGMAAWSILATAAAALLAGHLGERLRPGTGPVVLWATGLGTPLLFDGYLLIAHSLSAALGAGAVLAVARVVQAPSGTAAPAPPGRRTLVTAMVVVAACTAAAALLRTEALAFAGALAVGAVVAGRRRRAGWFLGAASAIGAGVGYAANEAWQRAIVGGGGLPPPSGVRSGSFVGDRLDAFGTTWLRPHYVMVDGATPLLAVGGVLLALAVLALRRRQGRAAGALAVAGGAATVVAIAIAPDAPVPGLLVACPLVVVALLLADRLPWREPAVRLVGLTSALFAAAVLATQYARGGSGEWGGRYFTMALPLVVPLAVVGLRAALDAIGRTDARVVVVGLAVALGALAVGAVATMAAFHDDRNRFASELERLTDVEPGDGGPPVVVATAGYVPRMAWELADERRWLLVDRLDRGDVYGPTLEELAARLEGLGVDRWTLVTARSDDEGPRALLGPGGPEPAGEASGWPVFRIGG